MSGTINKTHFFKIWKAFNLKMAFRVLISREPVALIVLMGSQPTHCFEEGGQ